MTRHDHHYDIFFYDLYVGLPGTKSREAALLRRAEDMTPHHRITVAGGANLQTIAENEAVERHSSAARAALMAIYRRIISAARRNAPVRGPQPSHREYDTLPF